MRRISWSIILAAGLVKSTIAFAGYEHLVGGYAQYPPGPLSQEQIGAGWGHRSMTFGMMYMMSSITTRVADILERGELTPEMRERISEILEHLADMMISAPSYMMNQKVVEPTHMSQMKEMLRDLDAMRKR